MTYWYLAHFTLPPMYFSHCKLLQHHTSDVLDLFWTVPFRHRDMGSPSCQRDVLSWSYHINTSSLVFISKAHMLALNSLRISQWWTWKEKDQGGHSMCLGTTWYLVGCQFETQWDLSLGETIQSEILTCHVKQVQATTASYTSHWRNEKGLRF